MIPRVDLSEITEGFFQREAARIAETKPPGPVVILGFRSWWVICERKLYEERMEMR